MSGVLVVILIVVVVTVVVVVVQQQHALAGGWATLGWPARRSEVVTIDLDEASPLVRCLV